MIIPENLQFQLPYEVGSFQVQPDGKISLTSLADLLQEIAWKHADSADFGRNLQESNQMWVLARLEINLLEFPKWGQQIQLFTGGRGADKLFAFREFLILDHNDEVLARAMSSWLLLNSESKRILKPESVLPSELFDPTKKPDWQPGKISISGDLIATETVQARFSDLDLNYHVNNTSYIRWVENLLFDQGVRPDSLAINYLSECVAGDRISIRLYRSESWFSVEGKVGDKLVFTAKV
ncbi:acyl-[acyl-carrier-protein] thioesterase [Algoriphagus boritolerans]|uniref:Acyl-ACP thioesterase n=1 Tax=Algoriphagus boritolerans DSM 17298 = JCM 18970 TaxID=1120964 RepID=A0A1H5S093_9BACT|nr:acyl-ACP thioesterase domain-containing protein [Algoriphagus boritolerans]SEF43247.1 Acyl-ACP thioesterase [Algoriphagus boritolerans DSM 17298 = JCM 18970]